MRLFNWESQFESRKEPLYIREKDLKNGLPSKLQPAIGLQTRSLSKLWSSSPGELDKFPMSSMMSGAAHKRIDNSIVSGATRDHKQLASHFSEPTEQPKNLQVNR